MSLGQGDWFKVTRIMDLPTAQAFSVRFPIAGLPENERPPLAANETIHTKEIQFNGLSLADVVSEMAAAFGVPNPLIMAGAKSAENKAEPDPSAGEDLSDCKPSGEEAQDPGSGAEPPPAEDTAPTT